MGKISAILEQAQHRAKLLNLAYSGALLPDEAYEILQIAPGAKLVDVRSKPELDFVGRIPGVVEIEWASYPGMIANPNFMASLQQQVDKEALVMFICRTGARSHNAALAAEQVGYNEVYNVLEGFEGDKNQQEQRNSVNGWRACKLPWVQS
ncbi:MAG: rhodanese-like domain-containing protein [Gallionellaceae bacterium]|jgi:rhodanese-related sulfurtransferase